MRIAIFHLAFIYSGGGEKLVLEEAKGLKKRGHEVTIFTPVLDKQRCFPDIIDRFNIKTLLPKLLSFIPEWETFQVLLACVLAPFLAYRFKDRHVILAANQPSPWLAFWVKKFFGVPYVAYLAQPTRFLHPRKVDEEVGLVFAAKRAFSPATYLMKISKPLADWADKVSIRGADLVLVNGEYARGVLEKTYGIKAISCPAGASSSGRQPSYVGRFRGMIRVAGKTISKPYFQAQPRKEGGIPIKIGKPYILLTNRHFAQKKFEYAISVLPTLMKELPNISLVITGRETDYTHDLKNLVNRLSLKDKVVFLGLVKENDLKELYSQAAVYVYTAPEEDFGMGMVEAMAHGTPVVAWNNAGPTGIVIDGKTGFLAKPFDIADFAGKIAKLLNDKKLAERMGRTGLERARKEFSWEKHINFLEESFWQVKK